MTWSAAITKKSPAARRHSAGANSGSGSAIGSAETFLADHEIDPHPSLRGCLQDRTVEAGDQCCIGARSVSRDPVWGVWVPSLS